jgi:LuxR family maltose regulon positive regulatory protein
MTAIGAAPPRAIGSRQRTRASARPALPAAGEAALPSTVPGVIARDALVERLTEADGAALALVVAPAGYGKTTLLAQWALRDPRTFAWVKLQRGDDDPLELARSIARAIAAATPGRHPELDAVAGAKRRRSLDATIGSLERPFADPAEPLVLVLDNADSLRNPAPFELIERLAGVVGPRSLIALSSRRQPALSVARLRTDRRLVELRTTDLALTRTEAAAVAAAAGLALDDAGCSVLAERTEGWPAGVYLAAVALRDEPNPQRALGSFGGDDRIVVDYVRDELLADLPAVGTAVRPRSRAPGLRTPAARAVADEPADRPARPD